MKHTDFIIVIVSGEPIILTNCNYLDDDNFTIVGSQPLSFKREIYYADSMVAKATNFEAALKYVNRLVVSV